RVDGSPLHPSELSGYRILYGTHADQLTQTLHINNPYTSEQRFENLPKNTYYFSIVAIDDLGNESPLSNIVEATLEIARDATASAPPEARTKRPDLRPGQGCPTRL